MRARVFFYLYFALAAVVLWPLATPLGVGLILGYVCEGPIERAGQVAARHGARGPLPRLLLSGLLLLTVAVLLLGPLYLLALRGGRELRELLSNGVSLESAPWAVKLREVLRSWHLAPLTDDLGQRLRDAVGSLGTPLLADLRRAPWALVQLVVTLLVWWSSAALGPELRRLLLPHLIPWPEQRALLCRVTAQVVRGLILANLFVAAIQSLLCTLCLWLLGVPHAVALGLLSLPLAFLPVVGTALITLGAAVYLFQQARFGAGVFMLAAALLVGTIDNMIRPFILHEQLQVHIVLLFLSLVGGCSRSGCWGS
jgi:predicted PurR-regulated permease PerM